MRRALPLFLLLCALSLESSAGMAIAPVSGSLAGAMVYFSAQQTVPAGSTLYPSFGTVLYETPDGIFDVATQPTRLTVPSGYRWVKIKAQIEFAAPTTAGNFLHIYIHRGLSGFAGYGGEQKLSIAGAPTQLHAETPWLPAVAGQYFRVYLQNDSPTDELTVVSDFNFCWFAMELKN